MDGSRTTDEENTDYMKRTKNTKKKHYFVIVCVCNKEMYGNTLVFE